MGGFDFGIVLSGVFAGAGGDFAGQEVHDGAVLGGGPGGAVLAEEGGAGGFFTDEAECAGDEAGDEPFEADGDFVDFAFEGSLRRGR